MAKEIDMTGDPLEVAVKLLSEARRLVRRKVWQGRKGSMNHRIRPDILDSIKCLNGQEIAEAVLQSALETDGAGGRYAMKMSLLQVQHDKIHGSESNSDSNTKTSSSTDYEQVEAVGITKAPEIRTMRELTPDEQITHSTAESLIKHPPAGTEVVEFTIYAAWQGHLLVPSGKEKDEIWLRESLDKIIQKDKAYIYTPEGTVHSSVMTPQALKMFESDSSDTPTLIDFTHDPDTRRFRLCHVDKVDPDAG